MHMFMAELFIIVTKQKQPKCASTVGWLALENIMISDRSQPQKKHILYDSTYMECPEQVSPQRQEVNQLFPRAGRLEGKGE